MSASAPGTTGEKQDTRFRPGHSGNPAGRPKGARHIALQALDAIGDENADALVRQAVTMALAGDAATMRMLLDRVWPARKGRAVPIEIPEMRTAADIVAALGALASATAAGELSAEEAQALAGVIEVQRKAIETADLAARIEALEACGGAGR